ncbi:hypothetical protein [Candidatus Phytoplasma solani]|uniref:Uncharacterized protein n=1 Tax=Candidatus Phytoplasma solani TaxID=69896 RepID=A0A421NYB6_9MOLU|nr:hypothetical protein [Candidatus Phytoplasma solani]RMI88920.1 hypothetical protein PSSA1_v1c1250 [Candidatus Phytoplasma solani]
MMQKQTYFRKHFKLLIFFITILFLFSFCYKPKVYAFDPEKDWSNYQKDVSSIHPYLGFKKADGKFFCSENFNFYGFEGVKEIPCCSYQEWLNAKQATKDTINIATSWIPVVGGIVGAISDVSDVSSLTDQFINENKQQIASLTDFIYLRLLENPGKGFFFFDHNQLSDIKEVKISFCDCDTYTESVNVEMMLNKTLEKVDRFKFTKEITKKIYNKIQQKSLEKITNKKAKEAAAKAVASKASKLGKFFGRFVGFGVNAAFIAKDKYDAQVESTKYLKDIFSFRVKNDSYEKTLGFCFYFESDKDVSLYTITEINGVKKFHLLGKTNLDNCSHVLIHILQNENDNPIKFYGAK